MTAYFAQLRMRIIHTGTYSWKCENCRLLTSSVLECQDRDLLRVEIAKKKYLRRAKGKNIYVHKSMKIGTIIVKY